MLGEIRPPELLQLTDDSKTGAIDTGVLAQIITNASGEIDAKVANIYGAQLPFNPIPSSVANMALVITCYKLLRRATVPDEKNKYYEQYKEVVKFLNDVNKGVATIDDILYRDFAPVAIAGRPTTYGGMGSNWPANSL